MNIITQKLETLSYLSGPDVVQVLKRKSLFFDDKSQDLLQFLHILWLMKAVSQHNRQNVVLLNPFLWEINGMHVHYSDVMYCWTARHIPQNTVFCLFSVFKITINYFHDKACNIPVQLFKSTFA